MLSIPHSPRVSDNPYAAPATFDAPPPIGRNDYPELDTKEHKRLDAEWKYRRKNGVI